MKQTLRSAFNARQYMQTRDFEVFYYSDLHFKAVGSHAHNYYEFYLFAEGNVTMVIAGKNHPLKPGDLVIVPPGINHHAIIPDSEVPYRRFIFWISQDFANSLMHQSVDYVYLMQQAASQGRYLYHLNAEDYNASLSMFLRLLEEIHSNRYGKNAAVTLDVSSLILNLNRMIYEKAHPITSEDDPDLFQKLSAYISDHLLESMTLDDLAEQFFVSKFYIAHIFKEELGVSIHQYITKKRLSACRDAMLNGANPGKIYLDYGFGDYSSFFRAFKKEYGLSPREYRDVYRNDPERIQKNER